MSTTPSAMASPAHPRPIAIAPSTNGTRMLQDDSSPNMPFTCVTCSRRKVKCDKSGPPCTTCRRSKLDCYYEAPAPRKRKRRSVDDVQAKLEHYEHLLQQHGILSQDKTLSPADSVPSGYPSRTPADRSLEPTTAAAQSSGGATNETGKLLSGRKGSRYIDSTLWRNLGEEELNPSSDEDETEPHALAYQSRGTLRDPLTAAVFGKVSSGERLIHMHPTYDAAIKLWKVYLSHVEPVIMIFHAPTMLVMVQRAAANPSGTSKQMEALLFAIYHFATVAMSDDECKELFDRPRDEMISGYYASLTQALVNAAFLRTTEMMVLQAYVLFLLSVRDRYDPHTFWILTGVAVRIAQRIGLHRDGEEMGLKPFDVQMRRRLFWQLLPLDGIASQLSGTGIAIPVDSWDTKQPLNVNDDDIWPEMTTPPLERQGATDMIFCLLRSEVGKFHQKAKPYLGQWGKQWEAGEMAPVLEIEKSISELENVVESRFLRYCDPFNPLHLLAGFMGRGGLTTARLRIRLPRARVARQNRADVQPEERVEVFRLAIRILDGDYAAHSNPLLKKFAWHYSISFQWDPLIWILNELRLGSEVIRDPEDVWRRVEQVYACHPQFLLTKRALHHAILRLTLKAWDGQPAAWRGGENATEPAWVTNLRAAVNRRQAQVAAANEREQQQQQPTPVSNTWGPGDDVQMPNMQDAWADTTNLLDNFDPDLIDWDQLIHNTGGFPQEGTGIAFMG